MSVTFFKAAAQPSFTAPTPIGLPVWETPFPELTERLVFRQRYMVGASYYIPATPNTAYDHPGVFTVGVVPTSTCYYLVEEGNVSDEKGGLFTFDRTYAAVPTLRREYTSMAYQYPAIITANSIGTYSSATFAQEIGGGLMFVNTSLTPNIGDMVSLSYYYSGTQFSGVQVYVREVANSGLILDSVPNFISTTYTKTLAKANRTSGRPYPVALVGRAIIEYSYAMITPGVTPVFTFAGRQTFTAGGAEVDYVSSATSPTSASYSAWVTAGDYFTAEDDQWSRWRGNIYEKRTTKVVAL